MRNKTIKEIIKVERTHSGQYQRYGDSYYEWNITTNLPENEVLDYMFDEVCKIEKERPPEEKEWQENVRYDGKHAHDIGYYFSGYYSIKRTDNGYHFTICHPYTD